jgi:hypothetical protein
MHSYELTSTIYDPPSSFFASLLLLRVTQATTPPVPVRLSTSYGLFSVCTSDSYLPGVVECRPFPQRERDCPTKRSEKLQGGGMGTYSGEGNKEGQEEERWDLCDSWITAGWVLLLFSFPFLRLTRLSRTRSYAHQLSLVFSIGALLSMILTLIGTATVGRGFRTEKLRSGWKLVAGLLSLQGFCLVVASSLVAYERNHDVRFAYGAHLGAFSFLSHIFSVWSSSFLLPCVQLTRSPPLSSRLDDDDRLLRPQLHRRRCHSPGSRSQDLPHRSRRRRVHGDRLSNFIGVVTAAEWRAGRARRIEAGMQERGGRRMGGSFLFLALVSPLFFVDVP